VKAAAGSYDGPINDPELRHAITEAITSGQRTDRAALIQRLRDMHGFGRLSGDIIVALGIFGTVCGVILTLMPFLGVTKFEVSLLQPELLKMFTGMAVAFFPTALSILLKVLLDINDHLLDMAIRQWSDEIIKHTDATLQGLEHASQ
jgi:hypothetical protein